MVQGINGAQSNYNFFQVKPVNEREAGGTGAIRGGNNFFVNPGTEISGFYGEYGVGIKHIFSTTNDVDGTTIVSGAYGEGVFSGDSTGHALFTIA